MRRVLSGPYPALCVWLVFLVTRLISLSLLAIPVEHTVTSDVVLYHGVSLDAWEHGRLPGRDYPWEYPPGAFLLVLMPLPIADVATYTVVFVLECLALDALVVSVLLAQARRGESPAGVWLWLLTVPLLGPMAFLRLDLAAAALCVVGLVQSRSRPRLAGAALALAASVKLWPALVLAVLVLCSPLRRRLLLAAAGTGGVLLLLAAAAGIVGSLRTSLEVQLERGLQVEAFAALPWLWAKELGADVTFAFRHYATEIDSEAAAAIGTAWGLVTAGALAWLARRHGTRTSEAVPASLAAAAVAVLLVGNKVLSPQYLLWLFALSAVACTVTARYRREIVIASVVAAALTHGVFPLGYERMLSAGEVLPLLMLTMRDGLLVVVTVLHGSNALHARDAVPDARHGVRL